MLLLAQDPWSHAEVRKLIALIATEHLRTQATFDALPSAVGVLSQDLRVIWANQRLRMLVPAIQEAESGVREALDSAVRTGTVTEATVGSEAVRLQFFPARSMHGEVVVMAVDPRCAVAPRGGAALAALEHCEVPVIAYTRDGKLLFANSRAAELTGYSREALLRMTLREISPEHHAVLTAPGDCTVTLRNAGGPGVPLRCRVKPAATDGDEVYCLTVIANENEITGYASNLSALEGCLMGAFPGSTISRAPAAEAHRRRFRIVTETHERVLTVTDAALRSADFRKHLREIPEALNLTRTVILTEAGLSVE